MCQQGCDVKIAPIGAEDLKKIQQTEKELGNQYILLAFKK